MIQMTMDICAVNSVESLRLIPIHPCYTLFQQCMWIWSHKFEAEMTSQGWIGINLKLSTEFTAEKSMVVWIISPDALTIVINSPGALTVIMNL